MTERHNNDWNIIYIGCHIIKRDRKMSEIKNMFSFNKNNVEKLITELGYSFSEPKYKVEENGVIQHCSVCNHDITKDSLGMIIPGSKTILCDNPACFSKYAAVRMEINRKNVNEK